MTHKGYSKKILFLSFIAFSTGIFTTHVFAQNGSIPVTVNNTPPTEEQNPFLTNTVKNIPANTDTVLTTNNTKNSSTKTNIPILLINIVVGVLMVCGGILFLLKSKKKEPCDQIKKEFETKNTELQNMNNKIIIQQMVLNKINNTIHPTKDTGEVYRDIQEKYDTAKNVLEFLKTKKAGLAAELATLDATYKKCILDTASIAVNNISTEKIKTVVLPVVTQNTTRKSTLLFLYRKSDKHILLALKKRGFGKDKWNGVGGKLENNETIEEALVRETREEIHISVNADDFKEVAILNFTFKNKPEWDQQVYVFFTEKWEGEPRETEEMRPQWYPVENLPYDTMWIDDKHWLPLVLTGKNIRATFIFNEMGSEILNMQIKKV